MGRVLCRAHGLSSGPMICEHLNAEVIRDPLGAPRRAIAVHIDMMDDGTMCFGVAICEDCARSFGLGSGHIIMGKDLEANEAKYPRAAPSCLGCVRLRRPDLLDLLAHLGDHVRGRG